MAVTLADGTLASTSFAIAAVVMIGNEKSGGSWRWARARVMGVFASEW